DVCSSDLSTLNGSPNAPSGNSSGMSSLCKLRALEKSANFLSSFFPILVSSFHEYSLIGYERMYAFKISIHHSAAAVSSILFFDHFSQLENSLFISIAAYDLYTDWHIIFIGTDGNG